MKFILSIFLTVNLYAIDLADMIGCYFTSQVDGKIVNFPSDPDRQISTIDYLESGAFYDLATEQPLDVIQFSALSAYDGVWYSYINYILPTSGAELLFQDERSLHVVFDKNVYFKKNFNLIAVDHYTEMYIESLGQSLFRFTLTYYSEARNMYNQNIALLRKVNCETWN